MATTIRPVPANENAEHLVLGAMLLPGNGAVIEAVVGRLRADQFNAPRHPEIFDAIVRVHARDGRATSIAIAEDLAQNCTGRTPDEWMVQLLTFDSAGADIGSAIRNAEIVAEHAIRRWAITEASTVIEDAYDCAPVSVLIERLNAAAANVTNVGPSTVEAGPDIDTFLNGDDPEFEWLVPGLLERGDRLILTGPEGGGKSTLLRQFATQVASGVHPFALTSTEPARVAIVDLENGHRHLRRSMRALRLQAGGGLDDPTRLTVICRPEGADLLDTDDAAWLQSVCAANTPDLLIVGPIYKLAGGNPNDEEAAKPVAALLDRIRAEHDCAVILEAHTPHGREERPFGASLWKRWPEFGIYLSDKGMLRHWRGQRDERQWPALLKRGGAWPWTVETDGQAVNFARILEAVREAGHQLSVRDIEKKTGIPHSTADRAIKANQRQYDDLIRELKP